MEDLTEAAGEKNARRRVWGSDWNNEHVGASNLDFFGEYLLDEIKSNLESLTCNVGGRQRMAIDMARTEISIDKDPAPNESVKERRIRGWVYFNSNFDVIMEDRQVLKQKTIQAFKAGMADFNDKYKMDYLVCKDMVLLSKSFKYGNDNKSMYFVFKAEEEKFHNERPQAVIVHKHSKESHEQGTCPMTCRCHSRAESATAFPFHPLHVFPCSNSTDILVGRSNQPMARSHHSLSAHTANLPYRVFVASHCRALPSSASPSLPIHRILEY